MWKFACTLNRILVRNAHSWVTFLHKKEPDNRNIFGGDKQPFVYPRQIAFVSLTNRFSRERPAPPSLLPPQETGIRVIRNDLTNVPGQKPSAGPGYVAVLPGRILSAPRRFVDACVFSNFRSLIDRSRSSPQPRRNLHRRLSLARTRKRYIR